MTSKPEGDAKTSTGEAGQTSTEWTSEQVEKLVSKTRSDALAEVGRLRKSAEEANKITQDVLRRLQEREERDLQREEEAVKDDPERLSALRLKREALKAKAEADEIRRQVESDKIELQTQRQEVLKHHANRLVERYNIDVNILLKYGGATLDSLEELAKSFGERTPAGEPEPSKARMTTQPESSKTKGTSGGRLTRKAVEEYSTAGKTTQEIMADAKELLNQFTK